MPMNDRDRCFILCFSLKWWAWGTLLDRLEKKWLWSPSTIVTYPWRSASDSRSGTTPAPRRVPRLDRRSKKEPLSPTFSSFFFSLDLFPHTFTQTSQTNEGMCCTSGATPNRLHYSRLHNSHSAILSRFYLLISVLIRVASLLSDNQKLISAQALQD